MNAAEAEGRLRELLVAAGVTAARDASWERPAVPAPGDPARAWAAFRTFAQEPIEGTDPDEEGDGILAEYLVVDWQQGHGEHFEVSLTRQFYLAGEDGEYHDQHKVDCAFLFTPTDELRAIEERGEWSFDFGRDLDAFFEQALALPGFQVSDVPVGLRIYST